MFIEESFGCQDHSRCAESTLDSSLLDKCFLKGMEFTILRKAFNSSDLFLLDIGSQCETGEIRFSFNDNRASSTTSQVATLFGSDQAQILSQYLEKSLMHASENFKFFAVDVKSYDMFHKNPFISISDLRF